MVLAGIDVLQRDGFAPLKGKRVGLLSNAGTIDRSFCHTSDIFGTSPEVNLRALFGPQHGLWGHTQDNMIEWEGTDSGAVPIYSLYGKHREPTRKMLSGLDALVVDIPDVGARYYTFIWTMALCIKACESLGIEVIVLDRPNPINGVTVEGTLLDEAFSSFVGLYSLPTRHGLTAGDLAKHLVNTRFPMSNLKVIEVEGWDRSLYLDETDYPWAVPSPNMPTVHTAVVYPGQCLLEATNLSEGRGTTRPFETFGAPWLDGWKLAESLNSLGLGGVVFRPVEYQPTFQKHAGQMCQGCFIHVTDRRKFEPVLTTVAILEESLRQDPAMFAWNQPPYEYEFEKLPIDILAGNDWLRPAIESFTPIREIKDRLREECSAFRACS
ncbi:MAG TPA: DUF1343 domain-containing protein [Fimbriimonadaceae bacterium]|nr:DUF1343 domain-containing protein [Fimbriimonadaceae bacterium]